MKYTVHIRYSDFTEVFDADILKSRVNIELKNILLCSKSANAKCDYLLDLTSIKKGYRIFTLDPGDIVVIQQKNNFIFKYRAHDRVYLSQVNASQIISYLSQHNQLNDILPYVNDDKDLFLNALLSDFIRNDYSYSDYNKRIKYAKLGIICGFMSNFLNFDIQRIIWDESVLGDIEIEDVALALHFFDKRLVYTSKIDNVAKILALLASANVIQEKFTFRNNNLIINTLNYKTRFNIVFRSKAHNAQYEILPCSNYIFELGENTYEMHFRAATIQKLVTGNVYVYNGDLQDWMIK
ncbi:MAG: hypothetical protein KatS3mg083_487 [Candidatus Dojkabacteria bacterium]|nr:MAG: hypothetical protein KatS3mg083_487 [Candidatus Dojkabacteria bacterium]